MYTIIKIPFDKCIVEKERRGTALGPESILKELKFGILKNTNIIEVKELDDFEKMHKEVEDIAKKENKKKNFVIGLGGDHSISYGLMKAFAGSYKNTALIYFDAHLDCEDDFLPPTHEDIVRAAVNEKFFKPEDILIIGARKFYPKELVFIKEKEIKLGRLEDIESFLKDKNNVYISLDIDVFDPEFAPGTGYLENNGLKPEPVIQIIKKMMKTEKIRGIDIVEVSPPKDKNNITVRLATEILVEFLTNRAEKAFV